MADRCPSALATGVVLPVQTCIRIEGAARRKKEVRESHYFRARGRFEKRSRVFHDQGCQREREQPLCSSRESFGTVNTERPSTNPIKSFTLVLADQRVGLGTWEKRSRSWPYCSVSLRSGGDKDFRCGAVPKPTESSDVVTKRDISEVGLARQAYGYEVHHAGHSPQHGGRVLMYCTQQGQTGALPSRVLY